MSVDLHPSKGSHILRSHTHTYFVHTRTLRPLFGPLPLFVLGFPSLLSSHLIDLIGPPVVTPEMSVISLRHAPDVTQRAHWTAREIERIERVTGKRTWKAAMDRVEIESSIVNPF